MAWRLWSPAFLDALRGYVERHPYAGVQAEGIEMVRIPFRAPQANGVFVIFPTGVADVLRRRWRFYDWDVATSEVRLMCSFDTTEADVDELVAAVKDAVA